MAKVLLIEDDETQAQVYLTRLLGEGYSTTWAKDGEQGLKMSLENHPSLILLDIRMPKMDGLTVMQELRKDEWGKNVPIILLTDLEADDEILKHISQDNPSYFLRKSTTDIEEVITKINETLQNPANKEPTKQSNQS